MLRGGNSNSPLHGVAALSPIGLALLDKGFVLVVPSMHVIDVSVGESFVNTTRDAARAIQWLRYWSYTLNVDPTRVFAFGHSAGGFHALYLGYHQDFQNVSSSDPVDHVYSRPDFVVPWGSPTDHLCFDPFGALVAPSWTSSYLFGIDDFTQVPFDTKLTLSPKYWLLNPALYGRAFTPPVALVYDLANQLPCGQVLDPHDGKFGPVFWDAMLRYCHDHADPMPCVQSTLIGNSGGVVPTVAALADWMAKKAGV